MPSNISPSHRAAILAALERLVDVIAQLRHPETGCPWDLAQTPTSLIPYVIEEAYEVVDAIHFDGMQCRRDIGYRAL